MDNNFVVFAAALRVLEFWNKGMNEWFQEVDLPIPTQQARRAVNTRGSYGKNASFAF